MGNNKKFEYRLSIGRIFASIGYSLISHEWWKHFLFSLLGFLIAAIWAITSKEYMNNYTLTPIFDLIVAMIVFGLWGYVGMLSIRHQYVPARNPLRGRNAVIFGVIFLAGNLGFVVYAFYLLIEKLQELP